MNKTLTINYTQDPTIHIESFLSAWEKHGTYQRKSQNSFELIGQLGKTSLLSIEQQHIIIKGDIPSETFMLIDALAKACESDQILEGEVLGKNTFDRTFNGNQQAFSNNFQIPLGMKPMINISGMSKFKVILMLIVAIPLLLVMIPVMIVYLIIKVILFKIKFR